jgi:hypothetical protein
MAAFAKVLAAAIVRRELLRLGSGAQGYSASVGTGFACAAASPEAQTLSRYP